MLREAGYACVASTMNPHEVCALHRKNRYDLICSTCRCPTWMIQVMEGLKTNDADGYLPVLVITAHLATSCARCKPAQRISSASRSIWSKSKTASATCWKCGCCTKNSRITTSVLEQTVQISLKFFVQQPHFQHVADARLDFDQIERLADEILCAGLQRAQLVARLGR